MIINMKFSSVNTKVSAMKANLLDDKDFLVMIELTSIKEVLDYLIEHTTIKEALWTIKGDRVHREDIERRLSRYKMETIEKLILYLGDEYKDFLKKYMLQYEIEDVKLIFGYINGRVQAQNITERLHSSLKYSQIDFKELIKEKTVVDVVGKLKGTDYYRLISPYCKNIDEKFNFYLDMVLDKHYFNQLIVHANKLKDSGKAIELLRRNIDLLNLEWIYRAVKFFDMSKEEILNFVLDYGYVYDYSKLKEVIYSFDLKNIKTQFSQTEYAFLFDHDLDIDLYMERRIDRYIYYKALRMYRTSHINFGKVLAFIQLLDAQVKDIIRIIESKRYHLGPEETSKYLIRSIEVMK